MYIFSKSIFWILWSLSYAHLKQSEIILRSLEIAAIANEKYNYYSAFKVVLLKFLFTRSYFAAKIIMCPVAVWLAIAEVSARRVAAYNKNICRPEAVWAVSLPGTSAPTSVWFQRRHFPSANLRRRLVRPAALDCNDRIGATI